MPRFEACCLESSVLTSPVCAAGSTYRCVFTGTLHPMAQEIHGEDAHLNRIGPLSYLGVPILGLPFVLGVPLRGFYSIWCIEGPIGSVRQHNVEPLTLIRLLTPRGKPSFVGITIKHLNPKP